ncbi:hypothetical protein ASC77_15355 [Nocardioides sp. Root1257]|nr:hypothetical protein ASC77_15355 [Nocardioides sp. Root1257]KRC45053.1 hypothetical protein ASE24_16305 [Nocardioides sp. Root224]
MLLAGVAAAQRAVLRVSYQVHRRAHRAREVDGHVVGMAEVAGLLKSVGASLPGAVTVNLARHPFYDHQYDIQLDVAGRWSVGRKLRRLVAGPWVLGRLAARHQTFIYIGGQGFLVSALDGRERELSFLRSIGRTVVCYFAGSEIRSQALLNAFGEAHDMDVITTYQSQVAPGTASDAAERHRRALASAADRNADLIFNAPVDQMSYLERPTEPCLYFYPDELIGRRPDKWADLSGPPLIVHAPSSPIIKGTPLVHAAIKALRADGHEFEYVELTQRPNAEVIALLERAHIVLNEFYSFVPGVFGVEAMAANTVLLTSADPAIEPSLPEGAEAAWVVTPYWRIYDRLKGVLDDRQGMQSQADRGTAWVQQNCSRSASSERLVDLIDALPTSA